MLLIDGYNLLHVTRFEPTGRGAGQLQRSREGLLAFLAEVLDPGRYPSVTIVFDAQRAPRGLPAELNWRHLRVLFARDHASADEMIETLIRRDPAPKKLTVVSSDHRIQRAAKRRDATYVDSDEWFDALLEAPPSDARTEVSAATGTREPTAKEVAEALLADEDWPAFFAAVGEYDEVLGEHDQAGVPERGDRPDHENPFPPGYFDDLADEFPGEWR